MRGRLKSWAMERRFRAFRGSKTSRAMKPGKRRWPIEMVVLGETFRSKGYCKTIS
jgi:hypothetical protein